MRSRYWSPSILLFLLGRVVGLDSDVDTEVFEETVALSEKNLRHTRLDLRQGDGIDVVQGSAA